MSKQKPKQIVRFTAQFDLEVSEDYLEKLQKFPAHWAIRENCFKNNSMHNVNATMEVLDYESENV